MIALIAIETLSLEGGRVSPGEAFAVRFEEEATALIAAGRAQKGTAAEKEDKEPLKTKEDKTARVTKEAQAHLDNAHKTK